MGVCRLEPQAVEDSKASSSFVWAILFYTLIASCDQSQTFCRWRNQRSFVTTFHSLLYSKLLKRLTADSVLPIFRDPQSNLSTPSRRKVRVEPSFHKTTSKLGLDFFVKHPALCRNPGENVPALLLNSPFFLPHNTHRMLFIILVRTFHIFERVLILRTLFIVLSLLLQHLLLLLGFV